MKRLAQSWLLGALLLLGAACGQQNSATNAPESKAPAPAATSSAAAPAAASPTQVAEAMIDALGRGDFPGAAKDFDATMKGALSPDQLKQLWSQLVAANGAFQKRLNSKMSKIQGFDVVFVGCQFAQRPVTLQVTVDADRKVGGFFIR
jgi:hypothetical protein